METKETPVKVIDEIKAITEDAVAKKQDAAKLNMPMIIEKIKVAAYRGESEIRLSTTEMNEYDKALLVVEGFNVSLVDREKNYYEQQRQAQWTPAKDYNKEWLIRW